MIEKAATIVRRGGMQAQAFAPALVCALMVMLSCGCQPVEISRTKPWWEKVQYDRQPGAGRTGDQPQPNVDSGSAPIVYDAEIELVKENADGTMSLNCLLPEYLVSNLYNLLIKEEYDTIFDHLISEQAKEHYREIDRDPREILDWLQRNRRDVLILCMRMSRGFNSPDVVWKKSGQVYRMELFGRIAQDDRFRTMDITRENGQFKLVLIK